MIMAEQKLDDGQIVTQQSAAQWLIRNLLERRS